MAGSTTRSKVAYTGTSWGNTAMTYCGLCIGHRQVWCPLCFGFDGCAACRNTGKVPCPDCAGGRLYPPCW